MSITQHNKRTTYFQPVLIQFWDLFLIELTNWRWSWRLMLFSGTITPLFSLGIMAFFAKTRDEETLIYILTGNIVLSLLFGTLRSLESRVSWLRFQGGIEFITTLPVKPFIFMLAMVAAFILISLPSVSVMMLLGLLIFQIPITLHPFVLFVIPACAIPLAGIGTLLALSSRSQIESGNWAFLLTLLMTGLGPVVVPSERLPSFVNILGWISPATFAASSLRQVIIGPVTILLLRDMLILAAWSVGSLAMANIRMQKRKM